MYSQASQLGLSYEAYWDMKPIEVIEIANEKRKLFIEELNNKIALAWYSASLQGIAVNNPKKFPKKPIKIEDREVKMSRVRYLAYRLEALYKSGKFSGSGGGDKQT